MVRFKNRYLLIEVEGREFAKGDVLSAIKLSLEENFGDFGRATVALRLQGIYQTFLV